MDKKIFVKEIYKKYRKFGGDMEKWWKYKKTAEKWRKKLTLQEKNFEIADNFFFKLVGIL